STGTGPYNPSLDPIMIDEWHRMAYREVGELTQRGVPGAWTHGFYDGWAPNYMFWIGMGHNTIGRFYETFGNRWPTTENRVVRSGSERQWFRPNPPLPQVRWSLRNNVNYQQSALLFALSGMAENRRHYLEQFYLLGKRSIAKAANEGPFAYVIDGSQKRPGNVFDLLSTLRAHGVEIHVADAPFTMKTNWPPPAPAKDDAKPAAEPAAITFPKGSFIIRMDQPYSREADTLLDVQYVRADEKVYDDTGWTLGYLKNVDVKRVQNADVLKVAMHVWDGARATAATASNASDVDFARQWFANAKNTPRIAVLHTWLRTQDEGWYRVALDSMRVPYSYISTQFVSRTPNLRERFDVIIFPPSGGNSPQEIVNGMPPGPPLPWKKTALTPNLGVDETDDMRPGLGMTGVAALQQFVEDGGLLITARDTSEWAVTYGLARWFRSSTRTN
ncbi:MAG TPA: hypothetical protein VJ032_07885, partial [Thermoanaerobaculia bacterium]|nr:hypothetical protein [Thermoanaerobaculia bacterium]